MINDLLSVWSANPAKSIVIWAIFIMTILYLGRKQAHQVLYSVGRVLFRSMRMCSYTLKRLEEQVLVRNQILINANSISSSALTQCFVSGVVIVVAGLAALINYQLIDESMAWGSVVVVGGSVPPLGLAALTLVSIEVVAGLFLSELLGITQVFSGVNSLHKGLRKALAVVTAASVVAIACLQVVIVPVAEQKAVAFLLPLVLALAAIPLAFFIHSLRVILGDLVIWTLRVLRVGVRVIGTTLSHLSMLCRHLYDLIIVVPLGIERLVKSYMDREVEIDVPMLTRVEAEALKTKKLKSQASLLSEDIAPVLSTKATIKSFSTQKAAPQKLGARKVIEGSSLENVNLAETMMSSSL